jgi:hypothetical protein
MLLGTLHTCLQAAGHPTNLITLSYAGSIKAHGLNIHVQTARCRGLRAALHMQSCPIGCRVGVEAAIAQYAEPRL